MELAEFWSAIELPEEARRAAGKAALPMRDAAEWKRLFSSGEGLFYQKLRQTEAPEALALWLYSGWALEAHREYRERGIPDEVFFDSFRDFTLWSRQCWRQKGRWGLTEWEWNALTLKLAVFRLGRLQYQPRVLREPLSVQGREIPSGTPVLELHIPEGGPLLPERVDSSLAAANPFFERYFSQGYALMHCHSWLLAPELRQLLPPDSNILAFQSRFVVYDVDYSFRQAEERVFGDIREDVEAYPARTGLQTNLKAHLLSGGRVGIGQGIGKIPGGWE